MEEVRTRIGVIRSLGTGALSTKYPAFDKEVVFLQFRMILELIAFGSLIANKTAYSAAHANFALHWKAKKLLTALEVVNAEFYPVPLQPAQQMPDGVKHFALSTEPWMTKDDFAALYDTCGDMLHSRNPFTAASPIVQLKFSVKDWTTRIQNLLKLHAIRLVGGDLWVVTIPDEGKVYAASATSR
jgi:hypothetical protein